MCDFRGFCDFRDSCDFVDICDFWDFCDFRDFCNLNNFCDLCAVCAFCGISDFSDFCTFEIYYFNDCCDVFDFRDFSDLVGKRGVTVINNSFGQAFDEYAREHLSILQVGGFEQALRMISNGRVDYLLYEEQPGLAYIERAQITNLQKLEVPVSREPLYLTMSLKSACNTPELKQRISAELQKMNQEGLMADYLAQARMRWQQR